MGLVSVEATDFGPFKHIMLPLQNQGLVWVGGENRDTKAADSNGAGKTSLLKAVTWCLYGDTIDGERGDKVIHKGAKRAKVVTLLDGDWKVDRQRAKGSPKLQLIQPDGKAWQGSKEDIQAKVIEMVGVDFKAFKNTVLYGQNDSARFANPKTRDGERKDMLHRIMRTEVLKQCHDEIKVQAKVVKDELKELATEIETLEARVHEHDLDGIQTRHDEWEDDRTGTIGGHKLSAKEHKEKALEWAEVESDTDALEAKVKKLQAKAKQGEKMERLATALADRIQEANDDVSKHRLGAKSIELEQRQIQDALDELDGDNCPTCTTPLDEGVAHDHIEAKKVAKKALTKKLVPLIKRRKQAQKEAEQLTDQRNEANQKVTDGNKALRQISDLKDEIAEAKAAGEQVEHFIEMARSELKRAKDALALVNPHKAALAKAKTKVAEYKKQIKAKAKISKAKAEDQAHLQFWVRGFSGQGLPSFILDSVMPFITERANHYLETLSDGDIVMLFSTQRELKSAKGEFRDEIDISWEIEGLDDSYPPSGGQLKKMEVSSDLALMDLVATREGAHLDILLLDEILDGLDGEGRQRILQLLHELRSVRGTVFVISHSSDVAEIFEKSINVVKEGGVAKLEMTA